MPDQLNLFAAAAAKLNLKRPLAFSILNQPAPIL